MRLSLLIEELALKFDPEASAAEDVAASAARTALVAQITALDAARAGAVGRGLQLAAEELHESAVLTSSQDKNIQMLALDAKEAVTEVRQLFAGLGTDRWTSVGALRSDFTGVRDRLALLVCDLVRKISSMPQSLSDYEAPQSDDRVQIETMLRQAMINGRDRLTAMELILEALINFSEHAKDFEQLLNFDTDALDNSTRQRLAALTRDQRLDDRILATKTAH